MAMRKTKVVHLRAKNGAPVCRWLQAPRSYPRTRLTENTAEVTCARCAAWVRRDAMNAPA